MPPQPRTAQLIHILLLALLSVAAYFGTSHHGWHLDDLPNIINNDLLHINTLTPGVLKQTLFAHPVNPGTLFRPVANLTFALNWFLGQDDPFGYHLVNIGIHCLTAIFLYLTCISLLQAPSVKTRFTSQASIALLAASFWAIAPIHTQAVTYIVQRMALLAALFSIIAIVFYLRARLAITITQRVFFFFCCLTSGLLALGSKENSILLPVSLLLIEYIFFFQKKSIYITIKNNTLKSLLFFTVFLTGILLIFYQYGNGIFHYEHRTFTLVERLLTEPRILLLYLSQIAFPSASSLSIEHDIALSTSLLSPWTTLPAIALCMGLIMFSLRKAQQYPLLTFAILFYFLNHLVESTVLPLELIFEHRNYLPSLFLFLPLAAYIVRSTSTASPLGKGTKTVIALCCASFLILSGTAAYTRNKVWATDQSLWQDAASKAPHNGRAVINFAGSLANKKQYTKALQLCDNAMALKGSTRNKITPIALQIKGSIYFNQGNFVQAEAHYRQALALRNDYTDAIDKLIAVLIVQKHYQEALNVVSRQYKQMLLPKLLLIKASLFLRLGVPAKSLAVYQNARDYFPKSTLITAGQAKALSMMGYFEQADRLYGWSLKHNEPNSVLLRIENSLLAGNMEQSRKMLKEVVGSVPLHSLLTTIEAEQYAAAQIPFSRKILKQAVLETVKQLADKKHTTGNS